MEAEEVRMNHESCTVGDYGSDGRRECWRCGRWIEKGNHVRHVRDCKRENERNDEGVRGHVKV